MNVRIEVYRVGVLRDLYAAWQCISVPAGPLVPPGRLARARRYLGRAFAGPARHIRRRQWRELKTDFNGYLAEPEPWPSGATRCGSGWTRRRALMSLRRHVRRPGVAWEEVDREIVKAMEDR